MLKILTVPEETEILRRKSEPVIKIDAELLAFLTELGETLKGQKDPAGVGLSAIQVGRPIRAFAMFLPIVRGQMSEVRGQTFPKAKPELTFYVNPEITEQAAGMTLGQELTENGEQRTVTRGIHHPSSGVQRPFLEGCLSIPSIYGAVLRYPWIKARATVIDMSFFDGGRHEKRTVFIERFIDMEGLAARVFQHELDHLNGILFTDHVLAQGDKLYREESREMVEIEM